MQNSYYYSRLCYWAEELEKHKGLEILQSLSDPISHHGNYQRIRFMDSSTTSQEFISKDKRGRYFIKSFTDVGYGNKALYPITAYRMAHNLRWEAAVVNLAKDYYCENLGLYKKVEAFSPNVKEPAKPQIIDYVPDDFVKKSLGKKDNYLYNFFKFLFGEEIAKTVFEAYFVGFGNEKEMTIFWGRDKKGFRYGKAQRYGWNGKRDKTRPPFSVVKNLGGNFSACLFGEHLVREDSVCFIVESEKTAMLCTAALAFGKFPSLENLPNPVFLATGGTGLGDDSRYAILKNKTVILIPDCDFAGRTAFGLYPQMKVDKSFRKKVEADFFEYYTGIAEEEGEFVKYSTNLENMLGISAAVKNDYKFVEFEFRGLADRLAAVVNPEELFFMDIAPDRSDKFDIGDWVVEQSGAIEL